MTLSKWLGNFEENEVPIAIEILKNLTVYSTNEIEEILEESITKLYFRKKKNNEFAIIPIGPFGKSGSLMSYFLQKTSFYKKHIATVKLYPAIEHVVFPENKVQTLVLIDDFIGSGKTVSDYYKDHILPSKEKFFRVYLIAVAGMEVGIHKIQPLFDDIRIPKSNIFKKAFSRDASYFGYRRYASYRTFCYKYGTKLTNGVDHGEGDYKYPNALGFENSQSLVCFAYGTPNNTLPIVWATKDDWKPLIPRFSKDKITNGRLERKRIQHELSLLYEFGSENLIDAFFTFTIDKGKRTFTSANKIDFSIYSIIKFSRAGFSSFNICHKLGLLDSDYQRLLEAGKKRGLFENEEKLTDYGLSLYYEAKKCIQRRLKDIEFEGKKDFTLKAIKYLPKKFNERS